jgi:uncharacterized protein (DUF433 family)
MGVAINSLLVRTPGVCGGRLRIDGTRITVNHIVGLYQSGYTVEEIMREYEHLPLAGVYAALAYYQANQSEVEAALTPEKAEAARFEAEYSAQYALQQAI